MPLEDKGVSVPRVLLRDAAYERLRVAITDGTLRSGERLRDDELSRALGVSRTPIREALARLEEEGLIETSPNRFTRVAPLGAADARAAYPIVAALMGLAAELAVERRKAHGTDGEEVLADELRAAHDLFVWAAWRGEAAGARLADARFHDHIMRASGNAQLARLVGRMLPRLGLLETLSGLRPADRPGGAEHEAAMRAIEAGDGARAAQALRQEWLSLGESIAPALEP